jgi:hypothetical protein
VAVNCIADRLSKLMFWIVGGSLTNC